MSVQECHELCNAHSTFNLSLYPGNEGGRPRAGLYGSIKAPECQASQEGKYCLPAACNDVVTLHITIIIPVITSHCTLNSIRKTFWRLKYLGLPS